MQSQTLEISIDEERKEGGTRSCNLYNSSILRLWRPAAQRNLRNQWSIIVSNRQKWSSAATEGQSHASSLINLYISRRYMPASDLGVLGEMDKIRDKACTKLARRQDQSWAKLSASYKDLKVWQKRLFKCSCWSCFLSVVILAPSGVEKMVLQWIRQQLVGEAASRLLLVELHSLSFQKTANVKTDDVEWSKEIYEGEFKELTRARLFSSENRIPAPPSSDNWEFANSMIGRYDCHPKREALQVYLTAWLAEVNVNTYRINEIISMVEEEMKVKLV